MRRKFIFIVGMIGICYGIIAWAGVKYALHWALMNDARSSGSDWARHIQNQLPGLSGMQLADGGINVQGLPTQAEFHKLVADVLAVERVYQIDYINVHCLCDISVGSFRDAITDPSGALHFIGDGHNHGEAGEFRTVSGLPIPAGQFNHVLQSLQTHKEHPASQNSVQFGIDRNLVRQVAATQQKFVTLQRGTTLTQPGNFAQVYYPVTADGETLYVLRMLVDLDEQAALYGRFLALAILLSFAVLVLFAGYPFLLYVAAVRQQQEANRQANFLAHHDVLTNLHNRNNFQSSLSDRLWTSQMSRRSALLFLFDLNGFKELNDCYGHPAGDQMLREFAQLLQTTTPAGGYVARLGGDEFVVMIDNIPTGDINHRDYLDIPSGIEMEIAGTGQLIRVNISGGVAQYPRDAESGSALVQAADLALYAAKPNRAGEVCAYTPQMKEKFFHRLGLKQEFRDALNAKQIEPYYQPIVNLGSGKIEGFEALARWRHPAKGILTPFFFGEMIGDSELGMLLGKVMFEQIADDMATWHAAGIPFETIGLNIVDGDLNRETLAQDLLDGLHRRGLSPRHLAIEVTEHCLFGANKGAFVAQLKTLNNAGCPIALDDFGTGYSSITQLKDLPITSVKIDKSFVDNVLDSKDDQSIISALNDLGHSMNFRLVLEGIETQGQMDMLQQLDSALGQGYHFARPMPAGEVPTYLAQRASEGTKQQQFPKAG